MKSFEVKANPTDGSVVLGDYRAKMRELDIKICDHLFWVLLEVKDSDTPVWMPVPWDTPMNTHPLSDTDFILIRRDGVDLGPGDVFSDYE